MKDHVLCVNCRNTPLEDSETPNISIDLAKFRYFIDRNQITWARLSPMERSSVAILDQLGLHKDWIVLSLRREPRTIQKWLDRFAEDYGLEDLSREGRPHVLSDDQIHEVTSLSRAHPFMVPRDIKHMLDLEVSARTIRRALDNSNLHGRVARTDYNFTQDHIAERLAFANKYGGWSDEQWSHVAFADEAYMHLGQNGKLWVQRPVGAEHDPQYMATVSNSHIKIGIWIGFSAQGTFDIHIFEGSMNMKRLKPIFDHNLLPERSSVQGDGPFYLLHDNARYHTGKVISKWYSRNDVTLIKMPAYSPDLNPTENLISILKHNVETRNPQDLDSLIRITKEEWARIEPSVCRTLATSMAHRLKLVVSCKGHRTGY